MKSKSIEELIVYAQIHLGLDGLDATYKRNQIFRYLDRNMADKLEPYEGEIDAEHIETLDRPDELIAHLNEELHDYIESLDAIDQINENYASEILGILSPLPSFVRDDFVDAMFYNSPKAATDYLYDLSIKNYYVQKSKIEKNIIWTAPSGVEITINLSKPEKDNKDIAKLVGKVDTSYPKCALCKENIGFAGNQKFVNRNNIRIIPMVFGGADWFLQFSPYGYFDEHLILVKDEHSPMIINLENVHALFDFIDTFPHYIIGSNSDLPITGGSILNHEHFQGGNHIFPMMKRENRYSYYFPKFEHIKVTYLDWYNSAFLIKGKDKEEILNFFSLLQEKWYEYSDPEIDVIAYEGDVRHNSLTPIVRKDGDDYLFYVILRNNRTNEAHPDGIFHAHNEYFHIKKEGIGLIEAMGYYVLPARLQRQIPLLEEILTNNTPQEVYLAEHPDLAPFVNAIEGELKKNENQDKHDAIIKHIEKVCESILENTGVFKDDEKGRASLDKFIAILGGKKDE